MKDEEQFVTCNLIKLKENLGVMKGCFSLCFIVTKLENSIITPNLSAPTTRTVKNLVLRFELL